MDELDASLNELLYVTLNEEPVDRLGTLPWGGGTVIGGRLLVASVICVFRLLAAEVGMKAAG